MKRDWIVFTVGFCAMLALVVFGTQEVVPVSLTDAVPVSEPVLVLDAGHGGEDGGASTASGSKESDINLSIVLKMDALLAFCGKPAVLTRSEDISLHDDGCATIREKKVSDLKNRVTLVNRHSDALLISVHQNYFTDSRYSGSQVFYNHGDVSRQWGEHTQELLRRTLDPDNGRRAKLVPDSVYLFDHISCPSILVECGFLSNGEEAALLLTEHYQRKIAAVLTSACLRQITALERVSGGD